MSEDKVGYVVFYDTQGDGLRAPSWGIYVCWGGDEMCVIMIEGTEQSFYPDELELISTA